MDEKPNLTQINLVATDVERTVDFYRRLGLDIPDLGDEWQDHHRSAILPGGFDLDIDSKPFARIWDRGWSSEHRMGVLGFRLSTRDGVDQLYRTMIDAGYVGEQPPYDAFWGSRYAVIQDPDGNAVGLMSPRDPEMSRDVSAPMSESD